MEYGYKIYPSRSSAFGMTYTHGADSLDRMEDQGERLSRAIKDAGLTLRDASDRFGWSYNTLKSNANGNATFSYKRAQVYAGRLKVRAEWLYDGALPIKEAAKAKRRPVDVPVIGWVQAGQLTDASVVHDVPELEIVAADGLGLGEWFATDVMGDSMDRVSPDGSRIFVNAAERALVNGGYYLFSLRGETTYKRYYSEPVQRLEPFSTNPTNKIIFLSHDEDWIVVGRVYRSVIDLN